MLKRRSARLLEQEEKSKNAKLAAADPIIQNSIIFEPEIHCVLPLIVNNLDPSSFARLARTCKTMNNFCFTNRDIRIPCWNDSGKKEFRYLEMGERHETRGRFWYHLVKKEANVSGEFEYNDSFLKRLSKMPFEYTLKKLEINSPVTEKLLAAVRTWLERRFPWVRIQEIEMAGLQSGWNEMAKFIQDAGVVKLESWVPEAEASRDVLSFLTKNLCDFTYDNHVDDDIILEATTKELTLYGARISKETFKKLVTKFVAGEIDHWIIGREIPLPGEPDPFLEAASEVVKTVTVMNIDVNTMELSVLYVIEFWNFFYLLKPDGTLAVFRVSSQAVNFDGNC